MSRSNKQVRPNIHKRLHSQKNVVAAVALIFGVLGVAYITSGFATDTTSSGCQAADTSLTRAQNTAIVSLSGDDFKAENADRTATPRPYALRYSQNQNYARFQTCAGDDYYSTDHRQRSELKENPLPARAFSDVFWVSFRVKASGEPIPGGWTIVHQIHQNRPTGTSVERPPALSFSYGQGLSINLRCGDDSGNITNKPILPQPSPYTPANGKEFSITYRAKIGQTNGEFAVWINGKEEFNQKNICFGYPYGGSETIPKVKFGIYRSGASTQLVVEYRDMKISPNGQPPSSSGSSGGGSTGGGSGSSSGDEGGSVGTGSSGTESGDTNTGGSGTRSNSSSQSNNTETTPKSTITVPGLEILPKPLQESVLKALNEQPAILPAILLAFCIAGILGCLTGLWFIYQDRR